MAEDVGPLLMLVPLIGEDGMVLVSAFVFVRLQMEMNKPDRFAF